MKIGLRTPSLKKSLKARTTGKLKRQMKKAVNPLYGKKGMGLINNPKKAVYNKVYSKATVDPLKSLRKSGSRKKKAVTSQVQQPAFVQSYRMVTYSCDKWTYIALAFFLGGFGLQYFYSGQKKNGKLCLLFCWTGIPIIVGMFVAITALFKKSDTNGNITITAKEKISVAETISDGNKMQRLLEEVAELEPTLKTTLDPGEYISTVKKIAVNLNEVTNFSRTYANNPSFNSESMAHALQVMVKGLDEEEINFINRYHNTFQIEGKEKILELKNYFSPAGIQLIESLYK
ncbi:TM2 domain-containing protein [Streptococcus suis]|uniref:TM2 domain-containing protein n=1 Tax=Streptococcus suis TaxID=1307 RepID=UPI001EDDE29E|nr:TM2 domain-containing protein [Streptococcus suis]